MDHIDKDEHNIKYELHLLNFKKELYDNIDREEITMDGIDDRKLNILLEFLKVHKKLKIIRIESIVILNREDSSKLLDAVMYITDVRFNYFDLNNNLNFSSYLKSNKSLQRFEIIGDTDDLTNVADALKYNNTLKKFYLFKYDLNDKDAKLFAEMLKINQSLRELTLAGGKISSKGAKYLADALKTNTSLRILNLYRNDIRDEGVKFFIEALETNKTIQDINLDNNDGIEDYDTETKLDIMLINNEIRYKNWKNAKKIFPLLIFGVKDTKSSLKVLNRNVMSVIYYHFINSDLH